MIIDGLGPCDFTSVARHVATKLDKAAPAALTFDELAEGYHHANPADLSRVKRFSELTSDAEATRWLIEQAVDGLRPRNALCVDDGTVRLADGKRLADLKFENRRIYEDRNDHERLRDAFNPLSGRFSENIRRTVGNLDDLRESMREFGWIEQLPAIKDERGVVLVGHRRLLVAEELGIEPVVTTIRCGDGDEGDARRFRLAIASNIGAKPFTPDERRQIAEYLYGEKGWSMERIGEALGVVHRTIGRDLKDFAHDAQINRTEKRGRPRGKRAAAAAPEAIPDASEALYRAAEAVGASVGDVVRARAIERDAPELFSKVASGAMSLDAADEERQRIRREQQDAKRKEDERVQALTHSYTQLAEAMQTLATYGRYDNPLTVMDHFEPRFLHPIQLMSVFSRDNCEAASRLALALGAYMERYVQAPQHAERP